MYRHTCDADKTMEVLVHVTQRVDNIYNALKVIYFAEKMHLEHFGRPICCDNYRAMKLGPVPETAYDIVKSARGEVSPVTSADPTTSLEATERNIKALRRPDLDQLSPSEVRCLDAAIEQYGSMSFNQLKQLSHDQADYRATSLNKMEDHIEIIKSLRNADEVLEYLASE